MKKPPNTPLQLSSAIAAQGVLRPPCSLWTLAAEWHVGQTGTEGTTTLRSIHT